MFSLKRTAKNVSLQLRAHNRAYIIMPPPHTAEALSDDARRRLKS